jgi:hypothetical protein
MVKRGQANQHLIQNGTQAPPVHGKPIRFFSQNLWCHILWRTTKGLRSTLISAVKILFGESKIGEFDVPIRIQ